ncbi:hypothetical protein BZG36_04612 [Bifiguratus adelaidae]|uniref:Store-operated calcium entry-associated regulatory factor n=1 Tax=Bifiguratus adelaidae TaxID=1938954 RepID=A0A261XXH3_9FUNG|nr:hypothetical protein BZG36_04612 [Bifiguratus adelaidae]
MTCVPLYRLLLALYLLSAVTARSGPPHPVINLLYTPTLHFSRNLHTVSQFNTPVPHIQCIGGSGCRGHFVPSRIACYNTGYDGARVQWSCEVPANERLDPSLKLGISRVTCEDAEGRVGAEGVRVVAGSCGVEITLVRDGEHEGDFRVLRSEIRTKKTEWDDPRFGGGGRRLITTPWYRWSGWSVVGAMVFMVGMGWIVWRRLRVEMRKGKDYRDMPQVTLSFPSDGPTSQYGPSPYGNYVGYGHMSMPTRRR